MQHRRCTEDPQASKFQLICMPKQASQPSSSNLPWVWLPSLHSNPYFQVSRVKTPFSLANWAVTLIQDSYLGFQSLQISIHKSMVPTWQPQPHPNLAWKARQPLACSRHLKGRKDSG